jgi:hypothetical protein
MLCTPAPTNSSAAGPTSRTHWNDRTPDHNVAGVHLSCSHCHREGCRLGHERTATGAEQRTQREANANTATNTTIRRPRPRASPSRATARTSTSRPLAVQNATPHTPAPQRPPDTPSSNPPLFLSCRPLAQTFRRGCCSWRPVHTHPPTQSVVQRSARPAIGCQNSVGADVSSTAARTASSSHPPRTASRRRRDRAARATRSGPYQSPG